MKRGAPVAGAVDEDHRTGGGPWDRELIFREEERGRQCEIET